ncbi:hypothetical protein K466DRAFT_567292, partial [Polyporus arcularius HHB13444]
MSGSSLSSRLGPWWSLFSATGTKYGKNGTYKNAWCSGCVTKHIERNHSYDQAEITLGNLSEGRSDDELRRLALGPKALTEAELQASPFAAWEAQNAVEPIYGRACTMAAHATRCHNLDPERVKSIVAEVARLQDVEKRAKELKAG